MTPCPFCGNKEHFEVHQGPPNVEGIPISIICSACGAHGPWIYWASPTTVEMATLEVVASLTGWDTRPKDK